MTIRKWGSLLGVTAMAVLAMAPGAWAADHLGVPPPPSIIAILIGLLRSVL